MKKNILKVLVLLAVFINYSCDNEMDDYRPYNAVTIETFYKTPTDFEQAVNALYSAFRSAGYYSGSGFADDMTITFDVMSDNLIINTEGRQSGRVAHEFTYNSNSVPTSIYVSAYNIISRANIIIDNIDNLPDGDFKNNVLGQALAVRAICHFDVARTFSKIPTQSADALSSIGIAYVDTFDPQQKPARLSTVEETYNRIITDLEASKELVSAANPNYYLNKTSVNGLLSRVYLYRGFYDLAAQRAQDAIDLGAIIPTRTQFPLVWMDAVPYPASGVLFEIAITQQNAVQLGVGYNQFLGGEFFSEYLCDYELYNLYSSTDVRKDAYITTATAAGNDYNHIIKYRQDASGQPFVNGKYLRTEEVYLNMAEAKFRNSDPTGALAALNEVRARKYSGFTPGSESGQALLDAILLERRLELAFEGDRFFTLKRLALGLERSGHGHFADGTGNPSNPQTISPTDHRWQLPIAQSTIINNNNIIPNPGYGN